MKRKNTASKEMDSQGKPSHHDDKPSKKVFFSLWFGQFISLIGTDITKFALRIWTYQRTQSVSQYAMITFFSEMPSILLSPIAGTFVDRYPRKWIMVLSDTAAAASTFLLCLMMLSGELQTWHIYVSNCIQSICNAFQWTAFTASVALLVPKEELGKYGGMNQMAPALSMLIGPGITGALLAYIKIEGIFFIEFTTFFIGLLITLSLHIPNPRGRQDNEEKNIIREISVAWSFIRTRPGLIGLLLFLALGQFSSGLVQVLMTPMILNFASPSMLGNVLSLSGTGALAGSILLSVWGGPKRKVFGVLGCAFFQGLLLASCGLVPNAYLILFVAFSYMFFIPLVRTCRESIWQRKAPVQIQGRIFATQRMIAQIALPLAAVISGPLADNYFEPMLMPGGTLENTVGAFIGVGPGRGVAFLFIQLGLLNTAASVVGLMYSPLRRVDIDLPDSL